MYSAIQVANFFIENHLHDKKSFVNSIKLQKLVYISYGWCWALLGRELFEDEIQAWEYGPIIPAVWHVCKDQGLEIKTPLKIQESSLDKDTKGLLDVVYEVYVKQESARIVKITHALGTPWSLVWNGTHDKIPKYVIWRYFELLHNK